ncbi:virion structural protein [Gordonia phage GMA6]|uniref:Uncharacterized protein n=1 Tax=Gordonia phage GMA6 TaxID=1647285 RepID=A0A0K0NKQ3_9CAUD|nr:virion structural protein [Gordonia phage GMA6]AKL88296.1 hypothetical protein GMA6_15 [Gordonia phage GMA6]
MMYPPGESPLEGLTTQFVDMITGFAIDQPLGPQAGPGYWEDNPEEYERIVAMREAAGITVADDMLGPEVDVAVSDGSTGVAKRKKAAPRKPASKLAARNNRSRSAKARSLALELKMESKSAPGVFPAQLRRYWLGEGLARWATTPTPYRSLVSALRSEGVPGRMINGLAARLYHWHFGKWPGKRGEKAWNALGYLEGDD